MTNLNLILIVIIWIISGIFLAHKQYQCGNESFDATAFEDWLIIIIFTILAL